MSEVEILLLNFCFLELRSLLRVIDYVLFWSKWLELSLCLSWLFLLNLLLRLFFDWSLLIYHISIRHFHFLLHLIIKLGLLALIGFA